MTNVFSNNRVFNGPLGRSRLRSLAPQRSAPLRSLRSLAPFTGSLTHFAHSLVGQLKILNMCSRYYRVSREGTRFWSSLETRPISYLQGSRKSDRWARGGVWAERNARRCKIPVQRLVARVGYARSIKAPNSNNWNI